MSNTWGDSKSFHSQIQKHQITFKKFLNHLFLLLFLTISTNSFKTYFSEFFNFYMHHWEKKREKNFICMPPMPADGDLPSNLSVIRDRALSRLSKTFFVLMKREWVNRHSLILACFRMSLIPHSPVIIINTNIHVFVSSLPLISILSFDLF